jgi:Escherichia/Staphylococcus phage prohead protease
MAGAMSRTISGFPILFDVPSLPIAGMFTESIAPGAVTRDPAALAKIVALRGHDPAMPLARASNETLVLRVNHRGLWALVNLPATTYADDLVGMREHGVGLGWSFAFRACAFRPIVTTWIGGS